MIIFPLRLDIVHRGDDGREVVERLALTDPGIYSIGRDPKNDIVLAARQVSREHAMLDVSADRIKIYDRNSRFGTFLDTARVTEGEWKPDQKLRIDPYEVRRVDPAKPAAARPEAPRPEAPRPEAPRPESPGARGPAAPPPERRGVLVPDDESTTKLRAREQEKKERELRERFPQNLFAGQVASMNAIRASGHLLGEWDYLTLGGGLGSFVWVDFLRCFGVSASQIRVVGEVGWDPNDPNDFPRPYYSYRTLCANSQIPDHERLRSNSISTPDNIWGFPGYALRETWRDLKRFRLSGLKYILQVFAEPALAESYTPRSGDVYKSLDDEARRIGWSSMCLPGRIIAMRKTDDGRYAVAYRLPRELAPDGQREKIVVARYVHVATGYPAYRTVPDIFTFNQVHAAKKLAVKAYDAHDEIYFRLEHSRERAVVVVRGRGIVASRILQRLYEARAHNPNITVLHQMRSALPDDAGSRFGRARRSVFNHTEHQPFNWPKACWGGELRREIEEAPPERRSAIYEALGGTTTADREDWKRFIREGLAQRWYHVIIGNLKILDITTENRREKVVMEYEGSDSSIPPQMVVDYVIDCIGLVGNIENSLFLKELTESYRLPRNYNFAEAEKPALGIAVTPDFEIQALRNGPGRVYAAGQITGHGPYAAVDSFLGLQYAALRAVDHLHASDAPGVSSFSPLRSFGQWLKWCRNAPP